MTDKQAFPGGAKRRIFAGALIGAAALLLAACQGQKEGAEGSLRFVTEPEVIQNPNPRAPLAALVRFQAEGSAVAIIEVADGETTRRRTYSEAPEAGLPVLGLKPDRDYELAIAIEDSQGNRLQAPRKLRYRSPALPAGKGDFAPIELRVSQPERMEPGITFLSVRRRVPGRPHWLTPKQRRYSADWGLIVAVDAAGEPVWYYESEFRVAGIDRLSNGNLLFHMTDFRTLEVDMLGNLVTEWYAAERPFGPSPNPNAVPIASAQTLHHQPLETPFGTFLSFSANARQVENYYTSEYDPDAPRATALVMGDDIIEFDRQGNQLWRWSTWDHLDPFRIGYELTESYWPVRGFPNHLDWTHGNGLEYDPRDDSVIINLRHQDALIKIDRESGEIVWILGEPTDWPAPLQTKLLTPEGEPFEWIYHAHNPRLTEAGTILLFDNGKFRARPFRPYLKPEETYSRTVEFAVDEENMTVRQVWASHDQVTPDNCFSFAMGDAHRLPKTGNILVVDSICDDRQAGLTQNEWDYSARHVSDVIHWGRVREYGGTDHAEVLFELLIHDPDEVLQWQIFGGFRTPDIYWAPPKAKPPPGPK